MLPSTELPKNLSWKEEPFLPIEDFSFDHIASGKKSGLQDKKTVRGGSHCRSCKDNSMNLGLGYWLLTLVAVQVLKL